jgi:hypothetical protein
MALPVGINNHVELVYRPGERALTRQLFELLGRKVVDDASPWLRVDGTLFASEVTPTQWAFEQELATMLEKRSRDATIEPFVTGFRAAPQHYCHFGIGIETLPEWESLIERVRDAGANHPQLRGRIGIASVFRPGDPGSFGDKLVQAFVRTDVFSAGLLTLGQSFELQHYFENDPTRVRSAAA